MLWWHEGRRGAGGSGRHAGGQGVVGGFSGGATSLLPSEDDPPDGSRRKGRNASCCCFAGLGWRRARARAAIQPKRTALVLLGSMGGGAWGAGGGTFVPQRSAWSLIGAYREIGIDCNPI